MSTHTSPAPEAPKGPFLKRFKPHQLALGLGIFMGVFTLASGLIPQFTEWHDAKKPNREVFEGIPGALQVAFYTVIPMLLIWGAFAFSQRVRNWERGAPDRRRTTPKNIVKRLKESGLKVQAQIQSDQLRVTAKQRDDLQLAIAFLRKSELDMPLQFENFRD